MPGHTFPKADLARVIDAFCTTAAGGTASDSAREKARSAEPEQSRSIRPSRNKRELVHEGGCPGIDHNGLLSGEHAMSAEGLITLQSGFGPEETMSRFEAEVRARGMTVFSHIDHTAGATAAGLALRPTNLLIFGAAKSGTPLMQSAQTIGIDLPLKALVWRDQAGTTFLSYNDPAFIAHRHHVNEAAKPVIEAMSGVLKEMAVSSTAAR
jgi:uncharacterized protein (DUF302 family)